MAINLFRPSPSRCRTRKRSAQSCRVRAVEEFLMFVKYRRAQIELPRYFPIHLISSQPTLS